MLQALVFSAYVVLTARFNPLRSFPSVVLLKDFSLKVIITRNFVKTVLSKSVFLHTFFNALPNRFLDLNNTVFAPYITKRPTVQ